MKKLLLFAMAAVALTFNACKNEPAAPPAIDEPVTEEVTEISTDSILSVIDAKDSTQLGNLLTTIQDQIETLKGTDPEKAKSYLETIQTFLKENADKIKAVVGTGTVATLVDKVATFDPSTLISDAAKDLVEGATEDVKEAAEGAVDKVKDAAADVKDATVDKANEAVDKVKDAAADVKDEAVDKANEAVDKAADKIKGAFNK